jgi:hypothetical protein
MWPSCCGQPMRRDQHCPKGRVPNPAQCQIQLSLPAFCYPAVGRTTPLFCCNRFRLLLQKYVTPKKFAPCPRSRICRRIPKRAGEDRVPHPCGFCKGGRPRRMPVFSTFSRSCFCFHLFSFPSHPSVPPQSPTPHPPIIVATESPVVSTILPSADPDARSSNACLASVSGKVV